MRTKYKIEKNVPVPDEAFDSKYVIGQSKYPFTSLKVNDSFWVPDEEGKSPLHRYYAIRKRYPDRTFLYAREGNGIRFWRVA